MHTIMFLGVESFAKSISRVASSRTRCDISPRDSYRESTKLTRISSPTLRFSNFNILESSRVQILLTFKLSSVVFSSMKFSNFQIYKFPNYETSNHVNIQISKYSNSRIFKFAKFPNCKVFLILRFSRFVILVLLNSRNL